MTLINAKFLCGFSVVHPEHPFAPSFGAAAHSIPPHGSGGFLPRYNQ
ncbi:hypothetical Protein YC6258_03241 [Gynuella sunshinyii YC6258]|uniref:Uncharacterized protein n=1 Tax=Gynuella sunshinyii YC6258 TaxID=1445510 RepID=A0A0C5VKT9_9GAMM|nr:hypothetical Protein YC6258_03241 [Gynuella sunshinyii YC6258]